VEKFRRAFHLETTEDQFITSGYMTLRFLQEHYPEGKIFVLGTASFIAELRNHGFYVKPADNEVLDGIRAVATLLAQKNIMINWSCVGLKAEMQSYAWDEKAAERGEEKPVKQMDHGLDALRYFVKTILPSWRIGII